MNKAELMEAAGRLFIELVAGDHPDDVPEIMGWDKDLYEKVRKAMFSSKIEEIRSKSPEQVYLEYTIEQQRNIHDLTDLIRNLDGKKQYNALVGSIRLRSDITDKILERGFDFGVIKRAGTGVGALGSGNTFNFIGGIDVSVMSAPELRDAIGAQLSELDGFIGKFGDGKGILELTPGTLHYGPAVELEEKPEKEPVKAPKELKKVKKKRSK